MWEETLISNQKDLIFGFRFRDLVCYWQEEIGLMWVRFCRTNLSAELIQKLDLYLLYLIYQVSSLLWMCVHMLYTCRFCFCYVETKCFSAFCKFLTGTYVVGFYKKELIIYFWRVVDHGWKYMTKELKQDIQLFFSVNWPFYENWL